MLRSPPKLGIELGQLEGWMRSVWLMLGKVPVITAVPATATSAGQPGEEAYEAGFYYRCVAKDTWQRAVIAAW